MTPPRKIYYVANVRMPTERAHGLQIAKMCEAMLAQGVDVELVVPNRKNAITETSQSFYGLPIEIPTKKIGVFDSYLFGKVGFWFGSVSFMLGSYLYLLKKRVHRESFVVYTIDMDQFSFAFLPFLGAPLAVEIHDAKENGFLFRSLFQRARVITVINTLIKEAIVARFGISAEKIVVFPNGIDLEFFASVKHVPADIPRNKKIAMYVGKFYGWKGMRILVDAARQVGRDTVLVIVGGTREEFEKTVGVSVPDNIVCLGTKPYRDIPAYLRSADVLLVLGTKENTYSYFYTSPMKLFEYMAIGRPIVASDTPAIRQVVSEREVRFYECDTAQSLARAIEESLKNAQDAEHRATAAYATVKAYSWQKRARVVLSRIFA